MLSIETKLHIRLCKTARLDQTNNLRLYVCHSAVPLVLDKYRPITIHRVVQYYSNVLGAQMMIDITAITFYYIILYI